MGKIKGIWRMAEMLPKKGESLAAIRVRNGASADDDRLFAIAQYFREIMGNPFVSQMAPFLLANRG